MRFIGIPLTALPISKLPAVTEIFSDPEKFNVGVIRIDDSAVVRSKPCVELSNTSIVCLPLMSEDRNLNTLLVNAPIQPVGNSIFKPIASDPSESSSVRLFLNALIVDALGENVNVVSSVPSATAIASNVC